MAAIRLWPQHEREQPKRIICARIQGEKHIAQISNDSHNRKILVARLECKMLAVSTQRMRVRLPHHKTVKSRPQIEPAKLERAHLSNRFTLAGSSEHLRVGNTQQNGGASSNGADRAHLVIFTRNQRRCLKKPSFGENLKRTGDTRVKANPK